MVLRSPKTDASLSSLKTIYLSGKAPWGFRIIDLKTSMGSSNIVVSKTRNNSKAELAGLKLNDTILYINDVPTSNLSLEAAAELIDNSENLCLIVSSKSSPIAKDESPDHVSELIDEFRGEETAIVAPNNRRELSSSMTSSSSLSRRTSSSVTAPNILTNPAYSRFLLLTYSNNSSSNSTANNPLNNASDKSSNISVSALSNNTASTTNTNTTTTSSSDPDHYHKQQHRHENQNQNQRRTIDKNYINLISSHRRNLRNNTYYSSANESNDESDYSMSCSQYNNNTTSNNHRYNRSYNYNNSRNSNGKANSSISNNNHNSGSSYSSNSNRLQSINRTGGGESLKRNEDSSEEKRVSYASITLRQPVKDVNYFSDTEALTGGGGRRTSAFRKPVSAVRFSSSSSSNNNKNNSNKHCYESSSNNLSESTTNPNTFYSTSINTNQRTILSNNHNSDHNYNSFKRREPFENHTITNNNNYNNYLDYFSNIFLLNNKNNKDQMNQSSSSSSFLANNNNNFNQAMPNMFNLSTATDFNRKPHGFSKLSAFGAQPSHHNADTTSQFSSSSVNNTSNNPIPVPFSVQPRTQPNQYVASANMPSRDHSFMQQPDHYQQQFQQPQSNNYLWAPQSQQVKMPSAALDDDIDDPVVERYEREMGSELAKPSPNKRNYADSYFYDSPVFRYPTIDEQKKLAKSIADTLEGSNPATSKYHKKKQTIMKQMAAKEAAAAGSGYDSETPQSPSGRNYYRESPNDFSQHSNLSMDPYKLAALDNDSTVPDIIKRSIAKASMTDPVRMVQAPDNFRQQHYTEHVTHTEMPPKAAMSLAAALESDLGGKGGRGAQIFQRRKAKSEKWVVDESNVKKPPGQAYNYAPPPPPQPPQPQPVYVDPHINSYENDKNVNFGDFNAKPRGWSNSNMIAPPKPLRIEEPSRDEPPQEDYYYPHSSNSQQKIASLSYNPNKIDLTNWTHPRNQLNEHKSPVSISKDGIEGLKARFYESARLHEDAPSQQPAVSKVKLNKLSSHQNYLFNNKNAQDALKNSTNQYYNNQNYYDESNIATSDL